ncbi:MAG: hypothetical protein SFW36_14435, partial [Leptolyngbyaceae cyanobacterium bins.59]|nr:hypothetical protein [Leptolyngbyaceae cyanobacterium bins.59]
MLHSPFRSLVRFILILVFTASILVWIASAQATTLGYLPAQSQLFQRALAAAKLTPADVRFAETDMSIWGEGAYRIKLLDTFFDNPWKISPYTRSWSDGVLANKSDLARLAFSLHRRTDSGFNPVFGRDTNYRQQVQTLGEDALAIVLSQLTGLPANQLKDTQYQAIPIILRSAVAQFLLAVPDALRYRNAGLLQTLTKLQLDGDSTYARVMEYAINTIEKDNISPEQREPPETIHFIESLLDQVDFRFLNTGAIITLMATQELQKQLDEIGVSRLIGPYHYSVETPFGKIVLSGQRNQEYAPEDYLLIVDVSGDDLYRGGAATRNIRHGLSVTLDLSGNDRYLSPAGTSPSFGAGILGYGVLMDMSGNDLY